MSQARRFLPDAKVLSSAVLKELSRASFVLMVFSGLLYLVVLGIIAFYRVSYPFELEWMEGASVDYVHRILSGKQIYIRPSMEFVPFIYPPLYYYLSAAVTALVGPGFFPLRLVSLAASAGCMALLFWLVRRETRDGLAALLSVCLFAATFRLCGSWFDIARSDMLFLLLALMTVLQVRRMTTSAGGAAAGLLTVLAYLTKQTALALLLPLVLWALVCRRRPGLWLAGTALVLGVGSTLLLDRLHDGWYSYYVLHLPGQHGWRDYMYGFFWKKDMVLMVPVGLGAAVAFLLDQCTAARRETFLFYLALCAGFVGGAWISRLHDGGWDNVLAPAFAWVALMGGLAFHRGSALLRELVPRRRRCLEAALCAAVTIQLAMLWYEPAQQVPTARDLAAGRELVATMARQRGEVYLTHHGYLPLLAGKQSFAHEMALRDIIKKSNDKEIIRDLVQEVSSAIRRRRFGAIILDSSGYVQGLFAGELAQHYVVQGPALRSPGLWPLTGNRTRPATLLVPR